MIEEIHQNKFQDKAWLTLDDGRYAFLYTEARNDGDIKERVIRIRRDESE